MITDRDRSRLTDLALRILDTIEAEYGPDARLGDAVIVFDVLTPDPDPDEHPDTRVHVDSTADRIAVEIGLLRMAEVSYHRSEPS